MRPYKALAGPILVAAVAAVATVAVADAVANVAAAIQISTLGPLLDDPID